MMVLRAIKGKKNEWRKILVNPWLVGGLAVIFVLLASIYLIVNFNKSVGADIITRDISLINKVNNKLLDKEKKLTMVAFKSSDDFKSYLDDGKRSYGDGIFEAQKLALASAPNQTITKLAVLSRENPENFISQADGLKYMSLGLVGNESGGDIIQLNNKDIYFSPENQMIKETKVFDVADPSVATLAGAIPQDGNFLISGNSLAVFLNNSLSGYDVANSQSPREIWRARVSDGSRIVGSKLLGSSLYLTMITDIDVANPCAIKPVVIAEKPLVIECASIYHPTKSILADSIFTVLKIDVADGKILQNISFVGLAKNSSVLLADNAIYAAWGQSQDQISFFVQFLKDKCKSLLPNYLLEKTAKLPASDISSSAKEYELRGLLANWFSSLSQEEQVRISAEILNRLDDYLRDNYRDLETTGIADIDLALFEFSDVAEVAGNLAGNGFLNETMGNLRVLTLSGTNAAQKMDWFITGKINPKNSQKILNNVYLLDNKLSLIGNAQSLDLPAGICATRFVDGGVFAFTCLANDPIYSIGFATNAVGLQGKFLAPTSPAYFYPFGDGLLLTISKNNRKIKTALFDATLPTQIKKIVEYDLNDYWADFDSNYRAFAVDGQSKLFFLPVARGGYVFSYQDQQIVLKATVGNIAVSRAFFSNSNLYLAGDDGIEIFGGENFAKIQSIKF